MNASKLFFEFRKTFKRTNKSLNTFLLENVKMKKEVSKTLFSEYLGVEPIEINSALVSAQTRKRLYWTNIPNITQLKDKGIVLRDVFKANDIHREIIIRHPETIRFTPNYAQYDQNLRNNGSQDQRYYYMNGKKWDVTCFKFEHTQSKTQ